MMMIDDEDYDAEVVDGEVVERGLVEGFSKIGLSNCPLRRGGRQSKSLTPTSR